MNADRTPCLDWHENEIDYLIQHGVIQHPHETATLRCVKQRWIHKTLREVFLSSTGFVLKRYSHFPGRKDYRRVWVREHNALQRLQGMPVPESIGFKRVQHRPGVTSVLYIRSMIPGVEVFWQSDSDIRQLARLLADFHSCGVVTLDPQRENFIRVEGSDVLGFIDFGRSRVYRRRTPLMLVNVAKELTKLGIEGGLDSKQMDSFRRYYHQHLPLSGFESAVVRVATHYWQRRHARKHASDT